MSEYKSAYTGQEIDAGIAKANTAIQDVSNKQDTLVSGTNIKTINNQSLLGSGNIDVSGGGSTPTDVRINNTSITSDGVANIITKTAYNSSTNKIATESDIPDISGKQDTLVSGTNIKTINNTSILGSGNIDVSGGGGGAISEGVKTALLNCFQKVVWTDAYGQQYYNNLEAALGGGTVVTLVSISAVCNTETALIGTSAQDLDITVTAHYDDSSTAIVTGWNTSGTVVEGNNTFTITYMEKTTTVSVIGTSTPPAKEKATVDDSKYGGGYDTNGVFSLASTIGAGENSVMRTLSQLKTPIFRFDPTEIANLPRNSSGYITTAGMFNLKITVGSSAFTSASDTSGSNYFAKVGYATAFTELGVPISTGQVITNYLKGTSTPPAQFTIPRAANQEWTNALNGKIYFNIPFWRDNLEDTLIYLDGTGVFPVGWQQGDILYAGQNTQYYGKDNIND